MCAEPEDCGQIDGLCSVFSAVRASPILSTRNRVSESEREVGKGLGH